LDLETDAFLTRLRGIYAIVNEGPADPIALTRAILHGGARIVQYRAKSGIVAEHAHALRRATREAGALFILNDRWDAVERFDADGAHLGPDDAAPEQLGAIRGALRGRVLGISCGTAAEALIAHACGADYIGVGSVFATASKNDAGAPIGTEGLSRVAAAAALPVCAIGGITAENIAQVRACGVAMAAVISAIAGAPDPQRATAQLVAAWLQ